MDMLKKIFYSLIAVFVLMIASFLFGDFSVAAFLSFLFFALGVYFIYIVKISKQKKKFFLCLTGISAAIILPAVILHNLFYAITTREEAFFFLLA